MLMGSNLRRRIASTIKRTIMRGGNPWLFSRYIRLAAEMVHRGDARAEKLFTAFDMRNLKADSFNEIQNDFLKSIISRKTAVVLLKYASNLGRVEVADAYYEMASRVMIQSNGATLKVIGFGMLLEWTATLIQREKWSDAYARAEDFRTRYAEICDAAERQGIKNPFEFKNTYDALTGQNYLNWNVQELLGVVSRKLNERQNCGDRERRQDLSEELQDDGRALFALSRRVAY